MMHYCKHCARNVVGVRPYDSQLSCNLCGRVLDFDNLTTEVQFTKDGSGQSQMSGSFRRTIQSEFGASRERLLEQAFEDMRKMKDDLEIDESSDDSVVKAKRFFEIAVSRNFTRGRRRELVHAACLYCACRQSNLPFLLIDFSLYLNVNVYELGAVYLQLCNVLYLADETNFQRLLDPSIFLPRFTNSLEASRKVCETARDILASMKRDWMTTGRKPSGLCGAALYISALTHGCNFSKTKIVSIVHVCEATLTKRLIEFENTNSGSLTIEDFIANKKEPRESTSQSNGLKSSGTNEVLCKHKDSEKAFAYGLCKECYDEFMKISEGLEGGSDPPAFQAAERERLAKESAEKNLGGAMDNSFVGFAEGNEGVKLKEPESTGDDANTEASDGSDNFSDIDDLEVDGYLHNEEEQRYKKIIWEEMNKEYLEEQAAKEAAAAAAKDAFEANYRDDPEGLKSAQELADLVAKAKKEKQQKRAAESKNSGPAKTALEATQNMLTKKRLSSKINYDLLKDLFDDSADAKKQRIDSQGEDDNKLSKSELESEKMNDDLEADEDYQDYEDDDGIEEDQTYYHDDYDDEDYGYDAL